MFSGKESGVSGHAREQHGLCCEAFSIGAWCLKSQDSSVDLESAEREGECGGEYKNEAKVYWRDDVFLEEWLNEVPIFPRFV